DDLVGNEFLLALDLLVPPAHETLDRVDGTSRVGDRLALGRVAHQDFTLVGESDDAGSQAVAFLVGDDLDFTAFHDRHDGVGCAQVDTDDFFTLCHRSLLSAIAARLSAASLGSREARGKTSQYLCLDCNFNASFSLAREQTRMCPQIDDMTGEKDSASVVSRSVSPGPLSKWQMENVLRGAFGHVISAHPWSSQGTVVQRTEFSKGRFPVPPSSPWARESVTKTSSSVGTGASSVRLARVRSLCFSWSFGRTWER